jgi:hypothetical protein
MPSRWSAALLLLAALLLPAARSVEGGQSPSSVRWDEGSRAAADTWPMEDGCPARTGASETHLFAGPREVAWRYAVPGEIEGEPVAWRGVTCVVERAGTKRTLHVLHTATGVLRAKQTFDTPLPLAPCLTEGRVLLRTSPKTLQAFAFGEKALVPRWTVTGKSAVGPAIAVRDEVYAVVDGVLQRRAFGSPSAVWPKAGGLRAESAAVPTPKGPIAEYPKPSLRGTAVYLATGDRLVEVDRADGTIRRDSRLPARVDARTSRVMVGFADVLVHDSASFQEDGREVDTARFVFPASGPLERRPSFRQPFGLASVGRYWVGVVGKAQGSAPALVQLEVSATDVDDTYDLAKGTSHPEFLTARAPATATRDLVFVGGRVFDAGTYDVVRADPIPSVSRTVPLRDRWIVLETRKQVTAWRSARRKEPPAALLLVDATPPPPARVALEDGRVLAGGFTWDAAAGTLRGPGKGAEAGPWPLASVRALLTDAAPRRLLLAARPDDAAAAVLAIARASATAEVLALVAAAVASGDAELARRAHTAAAQLGAAEADLAKAEKAVAALEAKPAERDEARAAEVAARLDGLRAAEADVLVETAGTLPKEAPIAYAAALVRAAVERAPYHSGATAWVRANLPKGLSPRGFKDLSDWIDFIESFDPATMRIFGPKEPFADDVPKAVRDALEADRAKWRDDLVGFLNGPLLVVSPPERPAAIARCLAVGRVVSDTLDDAFASVGPRKADEEVMVLELFPSQGEYLAQSRGRTEESEPGFGGLEHSAGHFSPSANVTRIYWGENDTDSVVGTYAHELTHHWIARRRPPGPSGASGDAAGGPGYWIVEGFADFVKGFDYDAAPGKADPRNPRADYADVVAGVAEADLVPWRALFTMSQREAYSMDHEQKTKGALRWRLGSDVKYSKVHLYYAQAAATTGYLFLAEDGKHRGALLSYTYDHYAGSCDPEAFLRSLGLTADELGARIVAWCRALAPPSK